MSKIEKSFAEKLRIRHAYNKRTGLYKFMGQIVIKLLVIIAIIVGIVLLLNHFFNLSQIIEDYIFSHDTPGVLTLFLISETLYSSSLVTSLTRHFYGSQSLAQYRM